MLPKSITNLIEEFSKLPGIGPKTAARLCFYLLTKSDHDINSFGSAINDLKKGLQNCPICYNIATTNPCLICQDNKRNKSIICVVEEPLDIIALEKTNFTGLYHVLGGVISPIDGIGPENLRINQLLNRLTDISLEEVIIATNPSLEGEATSMYISKRIDGLKKEGKIKTNIKLTRIARGLPVGGDLEYTDEVTLSRALEGRREM
ncbi:MAG: Recombination protein RecR [uncultured bacterium]|nr:MAG: Recombination protein RecR [uncultured bacterium]